ncbi:MAG TPA: DUF6265 family protein [Candidatus Polarisedimenticolaceae bacterium]|nr:DUF6265 family protein [Candidatus Polarisedimenticolaceae bacterium]
MRAMLACLCLISSPFALAEDKAPASPVTLADLSWLAGDWRGSDAEMVSQEVWTAPAGDSMLGMWRLVLEGKLKLSEHMQIVQEATGPVMHLRHFERTGVAWEERTEPWVLPVVKAGDGEAVFASAMTGRGSLRIVYRRQGDGTLVVEVVHGDGAPSTYTFRRAS